MQLKGLAQLKSRHGFGNFSLRPSNLVTNKQIFLLKTVQFLTKYKNIGNFSSSKIFPIFK